MKKVLLASCFGISAILGSLRADQHEEWSINSSLMFSQLDDSSLAPGIKADQAFDDEATGFDLYAEYKLNDRVSPVIGFNTVSFGGESAAGSGVSLSADDLDAKALYTGLKVRAYEYHGFELFARGDIGLGFTSDVDYGVSVAGLSTSEKALDGATDFYYGLGIGVQREIVENLSLSVGYQFRHYGRMDGNGTGTIPVSDFDVDTSSFDLSVGYRF